MDSMSKAYRAIGRLAVGLKCESDAVTAIEYALLAALIAVACVVALQGTGASLEALYEYWSAAVIAAL
jgi:pilus assembly protein Flp/PilA